MTDLTKESLESEPVSNSRAAQTRQTREKLVSLLIQGKNPFPLGQTVNAFEKGVMPIAGGATPLEWADAFRGITAQRLRPQMHSWVVAYRQALRVDDSAKQEELRDQAWGLAQEHPDDGDAIRLIMFMVEGEEGGRIQPPSPADQMPGQFADAVKALQDLVAGVQARPEGYQDLVNQVRALAEVGATGQDNEAARRRLEPIIEQLQRGQAQTVEQVRELAAETRRLVEGIRVEREGEREPRRAGYDEYGIEEDIRRACTRARETKKFGPFREFLMWSLNTHFSHKDRYLGVAREAWFHAQVPTAFRELRADRRAQIEALSEAGPGRQELEAELRDIDRVQRLVWAVPHLLDLREALEKEGGAQISILTYLKNASSFPVEALIYLWTDPEIGPLCLDYSSLEQSPTNPKAPFNQRLGGLVRVLMGGPTSDYNMPWKDKNGRYQPLVATLRWTKLGYEKLLRSLAKFTHVDWENLKEGAKEQSYPYTEQLFFDYERGMVVKNHSVTRHLPTLLHAPTMAFFWVTNEHLLHDSTEWFRDPALCRWRENGVDSRPLNLELTEIEEALVEFQEAGRLTPQQVSLQSQLVERRALLTKDQKEIREKIQDHRRGDPDATEWLRKRAQINLPAWVVRENPIIVKEKEFFSEQERGRYGYLKEVRNTRGWQSLSPGERQELRGYRERVYVRMPACDLDRELGVNITKLAFGVEFDSPESDSVWEAIDAYFQKEVAEQARFANRADTLEIAWTDLAAQVGRAPNQADLGQRLQNLWTQAHQLIVDRYLHEPGSAPAGEDQLRETPGELAGAWQKLREVLLSQIEAGTAVSFGGSDNIQFGFALQRFWEECGQMVSQGDTSVPTLTRRLQYYADLVRVIEVQENRLTLLNNLTSFWTGVETAALVVEGLVNRYQEAADLIRAQDPGAAETILEFWAELRDRVVGERILYHQAIQKLADQEWVEIDGRRVKIQTATGMRMTVVFEGVDQWNDHEKTNVFLRNACGELNKIDWKILHDIDTGKDRIGEELPEDENQPFRTAFFDRIFEVVSSIRFRTLEKERRTAGPRWVAEHINIPIGLGFDRPFYRQTMFAAAGIYDRDWTDVIGKGLTAQETLRMLMQMTGIRGNTPIRIQGEAPSQRDLWEAFMRRAGWIEEGITFADLLSYAGLAIDPDTQLLTFAPMASRDVDSAKATAIEDRLDHPFFQILYNQQVDYIRDTLVDAYLGEKYGRLIDYRGVLKKWRTGKRWGPLIDLWQREVDFLTIQEEFRYALGPLGIRGRRIIDKLMVDSQQKDTVVEHKHIPVDDQGSDRIRTLLHGTGALLPGSGNRVFPLSPYLYLPRLVYSSMAEVSAGFVKKACLERGMDWEENRLWALVITPDTTPQYVQVLQSRLARVAPETYQAYLAFLGGEERRQAGPFERRRKSVRQIDVKEKEVLTGKTERAFSDFAGAIMIPGVSRALKALSLFPNFHLADLKYGLIEGSLLGSAAAWVTSRYFAEAMVHGAGMGLNALPFLAFALTLGAWSWYNKDLGEPPTAFIAPDWRGFFNRATLGLSDSWVDTQIDPQRHPRLNRFLKGVKIPLGLQAERILRRSMDSLTGEARWAGIFEYDPVWDTTVDESRLKFYEGLIEESAQFLALGIEPIFAPIPYEFEPESVRHIIDLSRRKTIHEEVAFWASTLRKGMALVAPWFLRQGVELRTASQQGQITADLESLNWAQDLTYGLDYWRAQIAWIANTARNYGPGGLDEPRNWSKNDGWNFDNGVRFDQIMRGLPRALAVMQSGQSQAEFARLGAKHIIDMTEMSAELAKIGSGDLTQDDINNYLDHEKDWTPEDITFLHQLAEYINNPSAFKDKYGTTLTEVLNRYIDDVGLRDRDGNPVRELPTPE